MGSTKLYPATSLFVCASFAILHFGYIVRAQEYEIRGEDNWTNGDNLDNGKCEPITTSSLICKDMPYNHTIMPNLLGHQTQEDAGLEIQQFFPLIKVNCSKYIKLFLCSLYVPVCTQIEPVIPPCQSLCIQAKAGCVELMNQFWLEWPESLDCNNFPADGPCVEGFNHTVQPSEFSHENLDFSHTVQPSEVTQETYTRYEYTGKASGVTRIMPGFTVISLALGIFTQML